VIAQPVVAVAAWSPLGAVRSPARLSWRLPGSVPALPLSAGVGPAVWNMVRYGTRTEFAFNRVG
jgi:hypothetical protein